MQDFSSLGTELLKYGFQSVILLGTAHNLRKPGQATGQI